MKTQSISIRVSAPGDAAGILSVKDVTWLATYPNAEYGVTAADINSHNSKDPQAERIAKWRGYLTPSQVLRNWVVLDGKTIIGFLAAGKSDTRNDIKSLYLLPAYQRQGIGSALLVTGLAWLGTSKDIYLTVVKYNHPVIAAYEKAGFIVTGPAPQGDFKLPSGAVMPELEMLKEATS